ncbi:MAG: ATPase [Hyphomonas sp. BRH_c22]|uniref:ATP-binding protein n=1 Tax=Hyphomonas sp. BRH_c22 TaxID=1629710 RepID=UPI0005F13F67|nr:ATP-binding protein [Hyphomonas sp. BRH_c22]KJS37658.1 MAG: ATPase [Hyphomonas sp. BRH_c22]
MSRDDTKRGIGKVVSVAADRFVIEMHSGTDSFTVVGFDDVHYVARLGSFLMIPVQSEYVVAEVVGLRERDISSPANRDGNMDKASSAKYLDVVPVGMLPQTKGSFRFGVSVFPSLYANALYALDAELDRIFETDEPVERSPSRRTLPGVEQPTRFKALTIGTSVIFDGYDVKVRIDDFFGGHSAVLGNTGSGKSCTISSILQSLFEKPDEHRARGATFIVFDVNGEYAQALEPLASEGGIGVTQIVLDGSAKEGKFRLPHWFLEQSEWELLLQASERTQLPVLRTALGLTSLFRQNSPEALATKEHFIATCVIECFRGADGDSPVTKFQRVLSLLQKYPTNDLHHGLLRQYGANFQYGNFVPHQNLNVFLEVFRGKLRQDVSLPAYTGEPFSFDDLEEALDFAILYEEAHGNRQIRDYCSQMVTRFKSLKERVDYEFLRCDPASPLGDLSVAEFLGTILGVERSADQLSKISQIIIVNMNAVEDELVELVASVLARMAFRTLRQADPRNRFPVHLLLEEAHRYVAEKPSRFSIDASKVYERIAKEGRKYGLFVLVASQRPSELSKTVLSQCSNFVIHRIQNPDDLSQIRQMTPFISESVLKRLPSLPKQHALVFGTSVNLPTTFKVRTAQPLPLSDDAKIRELWFHEAGRPVKIQIGPSVARVDEGGSAFE